MDELAEADDDEAAGDEEDLEDEEFEDEEEEEEGDDMDYQKAAKKRQRQRTKKAMHKIEDIFEPQELERNLLTELDQQIRIEDKPERFMLRTIPVTPEPDEAELEREAEWIYSQAFLNNPSISTSDEQFVSKPPSAIPKVKDVLNLIRNEFLEVPFIAFYRKELIMPELAKEDLWKIYEMDEKYCQLKTRKENLVKLLERMQKYQFDKLAALSNEDEQALFTERMRTLDESDIERVKRTQSIDEFLDCYQHFHLHYGGELTAMKKHEVETKREERINKKKASAAQRRDTEDGEDTLVNEEEEEEEEGDELEELEERKFSKFASKKDRYTHYLHVGLNTLAKKFGLTAEQFGQTLLADYQRHEIEQWAVEPRLEASSFVNETHFQNVDQVLSAVRYMVASQFAREPNVRSCVRELYMQRVCISVRPTVPRGLKEIDENHACFRFKYLRSKPCSTLRKDDYLKLMLAEQDGLLTIKFEAGAIADGSKTTAAAPVAMATASNDDDWDDVPKEPPTASASAAAEGSASFKRTINEKLKQLYQKDEFSYSVEQWNTQRALIIDEMCDKMLFPDLEKELRSRLLAEAKRHVFNDCRTRLANVLRVAPFKSETQQFNDDGSDSGLRLLAIAYSTHEDSLAVSEDSAGGVFAECALINGDGELEESLHVRKINVRLNAGPRGGGGGGFVSTDRQEKLEDLAKLEALVEEKRPNVIVIGAENKDALVIAEDMREILRKLTADHGEFSQVTVELLNNEMAKLFEVTKVAEAEFSGVSSTVAKRPLVKQAIALARHLQDPLLAYAQLFNQDRDILALKLHPLLPTLIAMSGGRQGDDASELLKMLEIEFINRVNEVGVDLNRCNRSPFTAHCLQFVCGLGPRKAQHIVKVMRQYKQNQLASLPSDKARPNSPAANNRYFLVTKCMLGRRVFINSAGFVKFDVESIAKEIDEDEDDPESKDEANYTEVLDSTRIHPETYDWARKMAIDALDFDDEVNDSANSNSALKEILENPKRLKDLDLDAFVAELVRTGHGNKVVMGPSLATKTFISQ